jgi:hypothetical protein
MRHFLLALFDECACGSEGALRNLRFAKQPDVVEGLYASGWTPSPGHAMVRDPGTWPRLEDHAPGEIALFREVVASMSPLK